MSWVTVAKKDFRDAVRSKLVLGLTALFVLFSGGLMTYLIVQADRAVGVANIALPMSSASTKFIPLVSIVVTYRSIAGERESGSLKFLLGLPHTRFDVMVGKLVSRFLIVSIAIVVGYIAGIIPLLVSPYSFSPSEFFILVLLTVLLAIVYIVIAIAFSTAMRSAKRALCGAIGLFIIFEFIWDKITWYIIYIRNGFHYPERPVISDGTDLLYMLDPQIAYIRTIVSLSRPSGFVVTDKPFFQEWGGLIVLGVWITILLGSAYYRFYTMDLF